MSATRILIADDHAVVRAGLRLLIESDPGMTVIGEAGTYDEVLAAIADRAVDIVTLDYGLPGGSTGGLIQDILTTASQPRVVVLTMHDDPSYARRAIAAGAGGYVVKTAADSELLTAIRDVAAGRSYCTLPAIAETDRAPADSPGQSRLAALSAREREVLSLLALGHTNQQVADKLFLSVKTIESYRSRLMSKLGLHNRAELTQFAMDLGLCGDASS